MEEREFRESRDTCRGGDLVRWDKLVKAMSAVCNLAYITEHDSKLVR